MRQLNCSEEAEGSGSAAAPHGEKVTASCGGQAVMGKRFPQARIFAADRLYLDYVGRDTLYGYRAEHREELFRDEDFATLVLPG